MGTWGVGLYASDDALDLRGTIRAVSRLPHDGDELIELLAELNPHARDPKDEGHSTFWLVVADQFHRRGIRSGAEKRALDIIKSGADLEMLAKLGMTDADLRKRRRLLDELADTLRAPLPEKTRKTLRKPQEILFAAGDVLAYRIDSRGNCPNPYEGKSGLARFDPVGWDGCLVVASGLALEYLAWYQIATTTVPFEDRPTLAEVMARVDPATAAAAVGTTSQSHVAIMGLERLGTAAPPKIAPPPKWRLIWTTAQGISLGNFLGRWSSSPVKLK
jgi:hypothetical protein